MTIIMYKPTDKQLGFTLLITSFKLHYNIWGGNFQAMHAAQ